VICARAKILGSETTTIELMATPCGILSGRVADSRECNANTWKMPVCTLAETAQPVHEGVPSKNRTADNEMSNEVYHK